MGAADGAAGRKPRTNKGSVIVLGPLGIVHTRVSLPGRVSLLGAARLPQYEFLRVFSSELFCLFIRPPI